MTVGGRSRLDATECSINHLSSILLSSRLQIHPATGSVLAVTFIRRLLEILCSPQKIMCGTCTMEHTIPIPPLTFMTALVG
jgi:hypothetical protein